MKKAVFSFLMIMIPLFAGAQESQTGYNFLRLPVSAHAGALGGDNITLIEDDPSLMFNNPALLGSVSDKTVGLNFMTYMKGSFTASASYNKTIGERATVGVMGQFVNYGSMKEVDANNVQTGEFSAKDIAISGAFSYELTERLVGGITAKFITSQIADYNSIAMGVDLGVNYYDPIREWSLSAAVKNLGGQLKAYDEEYDKMPIDIQIGASKRLVGSPFRLSATLVDLNHWDYKFINHLVAGIDVILSPQLYIAAGYNFRRADEMSIATVEEEHGSSHGAGLSLGAGVMLDRFKLNLSYGKYHVSSSSLMVNVAFSL
ncbi:MAG: type IX secretion system protein PorQ [Prevotella sp.]|uniref:type IX secretion system protein PorQ n=1 Tax=Prevotella sp. TaxID=59823 RepID=UPI002A2E5BE9|nr:type IX secretion system protein PorQ [Prevotella sp.]MDD7317505.1 type IX secretion system protein PorQ [Prevotellaceae bacterium]MDY4019159.1 type IX secretion system protein PorQ [Prevotella sp.]